MLDQHHTGSSRTAAVLLAVNGNHPSLPIIVLSEHPEALTIPTQKTANDIKHILAKMGMPIWNATIQTTTGTIILIPTITRSLGKEIIPTGEST